MLAAAFCVTVLAVVTAAQGLFINAGPYADLQLKKVAQRAHRDGTDPSLDEIPDIVQDFEYYFANNGTDPGRTNAQRCEIIEKYGVVDTLA